MIKYKVQSKIVCLKGIDLMQFRFGFQKLTEKSYYIYSIFKTNLDRRRAESEQRRRHDRSEFFIIM